MSFVNDRMPHFPLALLGVVILGLLVGAAFPKHVEAANFWEFWHDIAVGSSTGQSVQLNCGWHTQCKVPYGVAKALDWEETNSSAYLAGATKWNGSGTVVAARVVATYHQGYGTSPCKFVVAELRNWYTNAVYATQVYEHVQRTGTFQQALFASPGGSGVRVPVGTVATSELSGCDQVVWFGSHVHQYGDNYDATNNPGGTAWDPFPNAAECNVAACTSFSNQTWMNYENWTY